MMQDYPDCNTQIDSKLGMRTSEIPYPQPAVSQDIRGRIDGVNERSSLNELCKSGIYGIFL
jgi:hypothetical protein